MELLFWFSAFAIAHTYLAYPAILFLATVATRRSVRPHHTCPPVSLIIPAHNEAPVIGAKIRNSLSLSYPTRRLQIIVVSDGSTDGTDGIVDEFRRDGLVFIRSPERRGKAHALNLAVSQASGDILVFTDANVLLESNAIEMLVRNFADPRVGAVVGRVTLGSDDPTAPPSEGIYLQYERYLHQLESDLSSMVSVDGALFAVRSTLHSPLPENAVVEDFVAVMRTVISGYRVRFEPAAVGYELGASTVYDEFRRKARIIAGGYQALFSLRSLLNPLRHPLIAFQLVSHKVLRWLVPVFLFSLALSNLSLLDQGAYQVLLGTQLLFYLLASAPLIFVSLRRYRMFHVPHYFCAVNLAALIGLIRFLAGSQSVLWEKVSR